MYTVCTVCTRFCIFPLWNATRVYMCYPAPFSCGCLSVIHLLLLILRDVADRQRTQRETPPHVWQASAARVARRTDAGRVHRGRPRYALPGRTPLPCPPHSRSHARSETRANTPPASTTLNSAQLHSTPPPTTPRRTTLHHTTRTQPHAPHITHILFTHTEQWQGGYCCRNKLGNTWASCPPTPPIPHFFNVVRNGRISITRRLLLSCQINIEMHGWRGLPGFLNIFRQPTERMDSSST